MAGTRGGVRADRQRRSSTTCRVTHAAGLALAVTDDRGRARRRSSAASPTSRRARAVRPETRFQIGSISKSFAALCVLQEEAKRDARPRRVGQRDPAVARAARAVRADHAASSADPHQRAADRRRARAPGPGADGLLARDFPATTAPGERFWYSNLGCKLVGVRARGRDRHADPRAADGAAARTARHADRSTVAIITPRPSRRCRRRVRAVARRPAGAAATTRWRRRHWHPSNTADGSIVSTVPDMCAYARIVLNGGRGARRRAARPRIGSRGGSVQHVATDADGVALRLRLWTCRRPTAPRDPRTPAAWSGSRRCSRSGPTTGSPSSIMQNGEGSKDAIADLRALGGVGRAARRGAATRRAPGPAGRHRRRRGARRRLRGRGAELELDPQDGGLVLRAGPLAVRLERCGTDRRVRRAAPRVRSVPAARGPRRRRAQWSGCTHGPAALRRDAGRRTGARVAVGGAETGFYRSNDPWGATVRVYEREGRLFAMWPEDGEELELTPLEDGWFAVGEPRSPRRARFGHRIDGVWHSFSCNGGSPTGPSRAEFPNYANARNATQAFCPPNPNEFDSASVTSRSRASLGVTSRSQSGSGVA